MITYLHHNGPEETGYDIKNEELLFSTRLHLSLSKLIISFVHSDLD